MFIVPDTVIAMNFDNIEVKDVITCTLATGEVKTYPLLNITDAYFDGPIDAQVWNPEERSNSGHQNVLVSNEPFKGIKVLRLTGQAVTYLHPKGFAFQMQPSSAQYLLTRNKPFQEVELLFCFSSTNQLHLSAVEDLEYLPKVQKQGSPASTVHFDKPQIGVVYKQPSNSFNQAAFIGTLPLEGMDLPLYLRVDVEKNEVKLAGFTRPTEAFVATKKRLGTEVLDRIKKVEPYLYGRALESSRYLYNLKETTTHHIPGISGKIKISNDPNDFKDCFDLDVKVQSLLWQASPLLVSPLFSRVLSPSYSTYTEVEDTLTIQLISHSRKLPEEFCTLTYYKDEPTPDTLRTIDYLLKEALHPSLKMPHYRIFQSPAGPTLIYPVR